MQALLNCVGKASRNWPGTFLLWHLSIMVFNVFHRVIKYTEDEREMPAVWLRVYLKRYIYTYIYIYISIYLLAHKEYFKFPRLDSSSFNGSECLLQ